MNDHDKSEPAFPGGVNSVHTNIDAGEPTQSGMTLRDYFAAKALQGFLANPGGPIQANGMSGWGYTNCHEPNVAAMAYDMADAMLAVRNETPTPKDK